jgi:hypothetical protein
MIVRFPYERRRLGWFIETRRFYLRFYPPILPRWTFWRKKG